MLTVNYMKFLITVLTVMSKISLSHSIECFDCADKQDCMGDICVGDYCMIAVYSPKLDKHANLGQSKVVKGCVSGNLLRKDLSDQCERFDELNTDVQMCMCDDKNFCNDAVQEADMPTQKTKLVKCMCSDCGASKTCVGEYCTIMTETNGNIIQSCSNRSLPLIERKGEGACMMPPISPNFIHKQVTDEEHLKKEVCLCAESYCNRKHPPKNIDKEKRYKCKMSIKYGAHGLGEKTLDLGECEGEHCFNVEINAPDLKINYEAQGCMSYMEKRQLPEELNEAGCVNFTSTVVKIKACFDTPDTVIKEPNVIAPIPPQRIHGGKNRTNANRQKPVVKEPNAPTGDALINQKKPEKTKIGGVDQEDTAEEGDGNTTIVVVFVVIMVIIVIAGVVWKFELHKKIFQARYQTVAG